MKIPEPMNIWKSYGDYITLPAMYEALAEECSELAKAAQKMARVIRKENPTPVTEGEAGEMVREEFTDVVNCAIGLGLELDGVSSIEKFHRMQKRCIEGCENER